MSFRNGIFIQDIAFFLSFSTLFLSALVLHANFTWCTIGAGSVLSLYRVLRAVSEKNSNSTPVKWESGFTNWFIVLKAATSAAGVITMNCYRQQVWVSAETHWVNITFLYLNILEALIRDMQLKCYCNAIVAGMLMMSIPINPSQEELHTLLATTRKTGVFLFPLTVPWIIMYTTWNACFAYDNNFSWATRFILIPPLLVSWYYQSSHYWLGARVLLLMTHLICRATQFLRVYQPGQSLLTPIAGSIKHTKEVATKWGRINLLLMYLYMLYWYHFEL